MGWICCSDQWRLQDKTTAAEDYCMLPFHADGLYFFCIFAIFLLCVTDRTIASLSDPLIILSWIKIWSDNESTFCHKKFHFIGGYTAENWRATYGNSPIRRDRSVNRWGIAGKQRIQSILIQLTIVLTTDRESGSADPLTVLQTCAICGTYSLQCT